jgi:endonuclease III
MKNSKQRIIEINELLTARYGIPVRQKKLPKPVDMLLATILSQNTNDNNSYRAYNNLLENFESWENILSVRQKVLEKIISVAGLTKQKAFAIKNFIKTIHSEKRTITLDYLKEMNNDSAINELIRFKGVGVKTASCVLLFSLNRNVCPVDTHVHRIVNRLGIVKSSTPDKTYFLLNEGFPENIAHQFHTNLIKLGREICKPQKPACSVCPLEIKCTFETKNYGPNRKTVKREFMLLDNVGSKKNKSIGRN